VTNVLDSAFDWMPLSRVEEVTGFSERRLRRLVKDHAISVMKAGREIRFDERSLLELKEAIRQSGRPRSEPTATSPRVRRVSRLRIESEMKAALRATTPSRPRRPRGVA
jgi:hypothetical protein